MNQEDNNDDIQRIEYEIDRELYEYLEGNGFLQHKVLPANEHGGSYDTKYV